MLWWTFWWSRDAQPRDSYVDWLNHKFAVDICRRVTSSRFLTHFGTFTLTFSKIDELIRQSWRSKMHEMNVLPNSGVGWECASNSFFNSQEIVKWLNNSNHARKVKERRKRKQGEKKHRKKNLSEAQHWWSIICWNFCQHSLLLNPLFFLSLSFSCFRVLVFLLMLSRSYRCGKHGTEGNDLCVGKCRRERSFSSWKVDISIPASLSFLAVPHRLDVDIQL